MGSEFDDCQQLTRKLTRLHRAVLEWWCDLPMLQPESEEAARGEENAKQALNGLGDVLTNPPVGDSDNELTHGQVSLLGALIDFVKVLIAPAGANQDWLPMASRHHKLLAAAARADTVEGRLVLTDWQNLQARWRDRGFEVASLADVAVALRTVARSCG